VGESKHGETDDGVEVTESSQKKKREGEWSDEEKESTAEGMDESIERPSSKNGTSPQSGGNGEVNESLRRDESAWI